MKLQLELKVEGHRSKAGPRDWRLEITEGGCSDNDRSNGNNPCSMSSQIAFGKAASLVKNAKDEGKLEA